MTPADTPPEAVQVALDQAACGLLQTATDGTLLRANRVFCAWLGYPAEALVGKRRFQDLLTMGGRIFHQTHWAPLLQMQGSVSEVKLDLLHAAGHSIPMVLNALVRTEQGTTVHEIAIYVARDRDKYERELVESRRRLEDALTEAKRLQNEAKDRATFAEQMMGIVSHDLRNPLATMQMGAVLLGRGGLPVNQQRIVERITRAGDRANKLLADLLDFTQARLGKGLAVTLETIDLEATVAEIVEELAATYPGRTLRHEHAGGGPCHADPHRLAQLIGNLVANAMAYGSPRAPVTVRSSVDDATFAVAVHNEGPPIPPALQPGLFEPMARGTTAGAAVRSVGLGLYIVNEIARAHGGRASVDSIEERGTTFTATFPRAAPTLSSGGPETPLSRSSRS